jgi:hypothetical protein
MTKISLFSLQIRSTYFNKSSKSEKVSWLSGDTIAADKPARFDGSGHWYILKKLMTIIRKRPSMIPV